MKTQVSIVIFTFLTIINFSCTEKRNILEEPKEVVITGQIINKQCYDPNTIMFIIDDAPTGERLKEISEIDEDGNFKVSFDRYYSQEILLKYSTIVSILVKPGDSIHLVIDAEKLFSTKEQYQAITFSGDAVNENKQLFKFLARYKSISEKDSEAEQKEFKRSATQYIQYRDSLRKKYHHLADVFIKENNIQEPISFWGHYKIEDNYFHHMYLYPRFHPKFNNLPKNWTVPLKYYSYLDKADFTTDFLLNAHLSKSIINQYEYFIRKHIEEELNAKGLVEEISSPDGRTGKRWNVENTDSLYIDAFNRFLPTEMRPFLLTKLLNYKQKHHADTKLYEKYLPLIEEEITEPFLLALLKQNYEQNKEVETTSGNQQKINVVESKDNAGTEVLKEIVSTHNGKVIYLDFWATWCGPCLAEMPYSRNLMHDLKDEDIEFVFLCCNSKKNSGIKTIEDLKLGGSHYFLTADQSNYMQKELSFSGYPNYVLIDKKGKVVESGHEFGPRGNKTKDRIKELLNE